MAGTNLNIAISAKGKEDLLSSLQNSILSRTKDKLNNVKAVEDAIKAAWYGEDCELFIKNFANARAKAYKSMEQNYANLKTKLNAVEQDWASFRKTNVKLDDAK